MSNPTGKKFNMSFGNRGQAAAKKAAAPPVAKVVAPETAELIAVTSDAVAVPVEPVSM